MNRNLIAAVAVLLTLSAGAQTVSSSTDQKPATEFQIVSAGPHQNLWQRTVVDNHGLTNVQSYTELATGLNFYDPASSTFQPSRELFQITQDGFAIATNGQNKVIIAPDLATPGGVIDFRGPDGQRLLSSPRALVFHDVASDRSAVLAYVTNCVGEFSTPNVIIFPSAFDSLKAAISYTYTRSGMAQDVTFYRRLPVSPADFNFSPDSTALEIWTEFLVESSAPVITTSGASPDQTLDFGVTRFARGSAYVQDSQELHPVPVEKTWLEIDNKHFLVESISYLKLKPLLDTLQASITSTNKSETAKSTFPDRATLVAKGFSRTPKPLLS